MSKPVIAVVIARGGSRRLPRKNVQPFCGMPLFLWSVIQAQCSKTVDEVYVSTDDDEIEEIAIKAGAQVIRRPDWPDADEVAANRVFLHAIEYLERLYGMDYAMVQLLPTSPMRYPDDIDRAVTRFFELGTHRILPMAPRRETFLYRKVHNDVVRFHMGHKQHMNEPATWYDNGGAFNVVSPRWYRDFIGGIGSDLDLELDAMMIDPSKSYAEVDYYFIETKPFQMFEVDTPDEFDLAEQLMDHYILRGRGFHVYYDYAGKVLASASGNWRQQ